MLKKIVSWISENPPEENLNEIILDGSGKTYSEGTDAIKTDDNWSDKSAGTKTSTSKGSLTEKNEISYIQRCHEENEENLFADGDKESVSITISDSNDDNVQNETKEEKNNYNQLIRERLSPIKNSFESVNLDNIVIKRDTVNLTIKSSSASTNEPQPSCLRNISDLKQRTTSGTRCPRSIFTHTEIRNDKQCDSRILKTSNKHSSFEVSDQKTKNQLFSVRESSLAHFAEKYRKPESSDSVYGTLFVVGCCKAIPNHLAEKMSTKYTLHKRAKANGLIEASNIVTSDVKESLSVSPTKHVILYRSNNSRSVVVVFKHDPLSDLFQIGRYEKYPVDFTVDDTNPQDKARHGVSRFACRISVRRDANHEARIYAGAFDSSQEISLSESCLVHNYCGKMDGFTTNGVLILKPDDKCLTNWREVSVSGYIYPLRSSTMDVAKRPRILEESNILKDGTLIDLCGVTLIWRTPEGLKEVPSEYYLNRLQSTLHKYTPEGSLLYKDSCTLVSQSERAVKKAYVYLSCGHVIGLSLSKRPDNCGKGWSCPTCRCIGPIKEFAIGAEPGFYFAEEGPSYAAFKPCGHVATQKTVDFWSSIDIPNHRSIQYSVCPFCGQKLNFINKYVKLFLPII